MCETISKNLILRKFSLKMTIFHQLSYFHIIMPILIWKHHVHVWTFYIPIRFSVHCESRGCNRIANHKDWAWSSICHLDQKYSAFLRFVLWSLKPCLLHFVAFFQVTCKWDHSFKTSANFQDFWTLPPTIGIPAKCLWWGFLTLMYCDRLTIGKWGHPSPQDMLTS